MNRLKHNRPELAAGYYGAPIQKIDTEAPGIYAFTRDLDGSATTVAVNLGTEPAAVTVPLAEGAVDAFSGQDAEQTFTLEPGQYRIYISNPLQ